MNCVTGEENQNVAHIRHDGRLGQVGTTIRWGRRATNLVDWPQSYTTSGPVVPCPGATSVLSEIGALCLAQV